MEANVWGRKGLAQKAGMGLQPHFSGGEPSVTPPLCSLPRAWGPGGGRSLEGKGYKVYAWRLVLGEQSSAQPPFPPPGLEPSVQLSSESGSLSVATFLRPVFMFIAPLSVEMSAP